MPRRVVCILAASCAVLTLLFGPGPGTAGASSHNPQLQLSTTVLVPGDTLVITGSGWPNDAALSATICGADAVSGTVDCAATSTAAMGVSSTGSVWVKTRVEIPPTPCPCVVLVTGTTFTYTDKIPVKVVGAATAPVSRAPSSAPPTVRISDLEVNGRPTLVSLFGGPAPRTLEFHLQNVWTKPVTPVLLGRWGNGQDLSNVIEMPRVRTLRPGQSLELKVPFSLPGLSIGSYTVAVQVQLVGYTHEFSAATGTSQWPIALFVSCLLLVLLLVYLYAKTRKRNKAAEQEAAPEQAHEVPASDAEPQKDLASA